MDNWKEKLENELKLKGYSRKTLKSYGYHVDRFLKSGLGLKEYLLRLVNSGKSRNTVRTTGFAVKFYLSAAGSPDAAAIPNVKRAKQLPVILSRQEIEGMIEATNNLVHRLIIKMLYATGMRASELINLQWHDIDFGRNIVHIKQAKGNKDRITMLSPKIKRDLNALYAERKGHVFRSNREAKYNIATIQKIIGNAARKAHIAKKVKPHTLRHSFATHLLEKGTDVRYIQDLLGHANLQTTMIYTRVSNRDIGRIKSPIDF